MTRFNSYLLNECRSKVITKEQANKLIKANCTDILAKYKKEKGRIYRGAGSSDYDYQIITPGISQRRSKNTRNYYTLLIDNLPAWKLYPKRSRSIVCSTDKYKAGRYGSLYVVLPYNKAKIGIAPQSDIWHSTIKTFRFDLMDFNRELQYLLTKSTDKNHINFDKDWKSLTDIFKDSEARIQSFSYEDISLQNKFLIDMYSDIQDGKSYIEVLSKIIDPNILNFQLKTPKTIDLTGDNEVWVGKSSSILVHENVEYL